MIFEGFISGLLAKTYVLAALSSCPIQDAPKVTVNFAADPPYYDETVSTTKLTEVMAKDKESTFANDSRWMVGGVTTSVIKDQLRVTFRTLTDESGQVCFYVNTATFVIYYYPAVFIAKEAVKRDCYYQVVRAHENTHVAIDVKSINEYLPKVKMEMLLYLRSLGYYGFGPYTAAEAAKQQALMTKKIIEAGVPMIEKLRDVRRQRQGEIDTVENYRRESAKCPGDFEEMMKDVGLKAE
jgi:hypothetical protein